MRGCFRICEPADARKAPQKRNASWVARVAEAEGLRMCETAWARLASHVRSCAGQRVCAVIVCLVLVCILFPIITFRNIPAIHRILLLAVVILTALGNVRGRHKVQKWETIEYSAISCRAHTASLTDFGGVGDGTTLNTKAFKMAVDHLSQFQSDGGSLLYVPAGKWLTGSFNLTSHFTMYLDKDAVSIAISL
nr:probable polygalacturonase [Nicotiana tomentosiformis]